MRSKLRNKKTGEIKDLQEVIHQAYQEHNYSSLAELNEEWEDMPEEPKGTWTIDPMNEDYIDDGKYTAPDELERYEELGLKFDTKEEAEKAVEKLKAWKRLKDARFEFCSIKYNLDEDSSSTLAYDGIIPIKGIAYEDFVDDLYLLFGGEE